MNELSVSEGSIEHLIEMMNNLLEEEKCLHQSLEKAGVDIKNDEVQLVLGHLESSVCALYNVVQAIEIESGFYENEWDKLDDEWEIEPENEDQIF